MRTPTCAWLWKAVFAFTITALFGFHTAPGTVDKPDLSTPEKSFQAFVTALKSSDTEALKYVATPTGISSLVALYTHEAYRDGMTVLGTDLERATLSYEQITDDIYFVKAFWNGEVHKMEFTLEEPGWMLYHWQLGGPTH